MNAVEIEEAISALAEQKFDSEKFLYAFLEAFGRKPATIKRLKAGNTNSSDIDGDALQRNHIHIAVCKEGEVSETPIRLKNGPAATKAKAPFVIDRFVNPVVPQEWILVPLFVIDEVVERIKDGTINKYTYDSSATPLVEVECRSH